MADIIGNYKRFIIFPETAPMFRRIHNTLALKQKSSNR